MAFHEIQFPPRISRGSTASPAFYTSVIDIPESGHVERVARRLRPRRTYNAALGIDRKEDFGEIIDFFVCRGGSAHGFRWKDWSDFTSSSDHVSAPDDEDQVIGVGDASDVAFQLVKTYESGAQTLERTIQKPIAGTIVVALDGTPQPTGWSVNTATGILTFSAAPGAGVEITAGFEFDVPVIFGEQADRGFDLAIRDQNFRTVGRIPVVELLDEDAAEEDFLYGGAAHTTMTEDASLAAQDERAQAYTPDAARNLTLPDETDLPCGGPYFYITNLSGTYAITLKDYADATVATLPVNSVTEVILGKDASGKKWYVL